MNPFKSYILLCICLSVIHVFPKNCVELKSRIVCGKESSLIIWRESYKDGSAALFYSIIGDSARIKLTSDNLMESYFDPVGTSCTDTSFLVAWQTSNRKKGSSIDGAIILSNGTLSKRWKISDFQNADRYHPVISSVQSTACYILWQDASAGSYDILGMLLTHSGAAITSLPILNDDTTKVSHYWPVVTAIPEKAFAAWFDRRGGKSQIWGQWISENGEKVNTNFLIAPQPDHDQTIPSLSADNSRIAVTWQEQSGSKSAIRLCFIDGDRIKAPVNASGDFSNAARSDCRCAFFHDGKLAVVWMSQSEGNLGVFCRLYGRDRNRIGEAFSIDAIDTMLHQCGLKKNVQSHRPKNTTTREQILPDIGINQDGTMFIAWTEMTDSVAFLKLKVDSMPWRGWVAPNYYPEISRRYWLQSPVPSPFHSYVKIQFELPKDEHVIIAVYNAAGREIVRLADQQFAQGYHMIGWNCRGGTGISIASGNYYMVMICKNFSMKRKLTKV
ncbi:MAG: hypothetical protein JW795_01915 [Chitinivibrionales bacterium]|nr:hypothetical protein [Chitinivibrionales bacterium]